MHGSTEAVDVLRRLFVGNRKGGVLSAILQNVTYCLLPFVEGEKKKKTGPVEFVRAEYKARVNEKNNHGMKHIPILIKYRDAHEPSQAHPGTWGQRVLDEIELRSKKIVESNCTTGVKGVNIRECKSAHGILDVGSKIYVVSSHVSQATVQKWNSVELELLCGCCCWLGSNAKARLRTMLNATAAVTENLLHVDDVQVISGWLNSRCKI
ncbi:hypothetical protein B0H14DRAFT_2589436 [Mycena olivaceomarginata]|nr:hypothetical protein B0H14DRAFT_2589436 [Mycena olivaceomarginata]